MKDNFLQLILHRAIWIAYLEQDKLSEALFSFEAYKKELLECEEKEDSEKEILYSNNLLIEKLSQKAAGYFESKNYVNAIMCYKYIFDTKPENTDNIKNYITCLEKLSQFDLQLELSKLYARRLKNGESYKVLSNAYDKNQEYYKAVEYYNKYLNAENKTKLTSADYNLLGCHYFNAYVKKAQMPDDAKNALKYFQLALEGNPSSKAYLKNAIVAAMKAKDYSVEKKCWDEYLKRGYASKDDEFTYCASCMRNGDIKEWAKYYGSRFEKNEPTIYPKINKPEWSGKEDLSNSTLLVHYEQGYGDNFLMFGYMPKLVKMAKHVIYYIQNNAYELVKNNELGVEIVCHNMEPDVNKLNFDYHVPCMSLPVVLDLDKTNISVGGGYIKPSAELVSQFKNKYFNNNKFKIGIAFEGVAANNKRDIPFENLLSLDKLENVQLYCLTKDVDDEKLKAFKHNKVINVAKDFNNFADTAAAIENTDIVLSSDNCILNLAGAIGKKTIGVFNYHYEFRWYDLTGETCGWFDSVKPIVNNEYNDWSLSIQKALDLIKQAMKAED